MPEVQNHGFVFQDMIKRIFKVDHLKSKYTQKWDIPGKKPISIKFMGLTNALEFSSAVRMWEIKKAFTLVVGRWVQDGDTKIIKSVDKIDISLDQLSKLKGNITLKELKQFDKKIKSFPAGEDGQKEGIRFAEKWKAERKSRMGLLTITHKIDSKNQRRIQCNLNYTNYVRLFGEPSMKTKFMGIEFNQTINHPSRVLKKKRI